MEIEGRFKFIGKMSDFKQILNRLKNKYGKSAKLIDVIKLEYQKKEVELN